MKTTTIKHLLLVTSTLVSLAACNKDLEPYNAKSDDTALSSPSDLQTATYGAYAGLVNADYTLNLYWMSQYPDDDVALSGTTSNTLYNNYTYTHFPGMVNTTAFWKQSYKVIYSANRIIEKIKDGESTTLDQLKGENLYLRAMAHFHLVRFFGRPYPQGQGQNPGIVIKDNTLNDQPSRKSVKEVYDFVIADLLKAATLMTVNKNSCFASKEVAYALLSRIYLYKEDNANAILYANKVISSNRYKMLETEPYKKYFTSVPENNTETIFAMRHTQADNRFKSAIGNQFYNDPITQSTGYGESYASQVLVNLVDQNPQDVRHSFIEPQRNASGQMLTRGNTPKYFMNKFNWQEGVANLSSPVILRLAEMYLIRAEANAKMG
ncbi:MAG: RagB/SusD family nutrient uptake outer membrane protein, partial [Chitinophagaceae bacterium]